MLASSEEAFRKLGVGTVISVSTSEGWETAGCPSELFLARIVCPCRWQVVQTTPNLPGCELARVPVSPPSSSGSQGGLRALEQRLLPGVLGGDGGLCRYSPDLLPWRPQRRCWERLWRARWGFLPSPNFLFQLVMLFCPWTFACERDQNSSFKKKKPFSHKFQFGVLFYSLFALFLLWMIFFIHLASCVGEGLSPAKGRRIWMFSTNK